MRNPITRRSLLAASAGAALAQSAAGAAVRLPESLRVAIIGMEGHISEVTGAVGKVPGLKIVAVADPDPEQLRRASRFPGAKTYADYRAMLDREKPDLVAIGGENGTRGGIVRECASHRIAIVSEKPLTPDLEELAAVRKIVMENRVPLTMLLPMRFYPAYAGMREVVRRGEIGEPVLITAQKSYKLGTRPDWMKRRKSYGGTIPYIGIHMTDLMRWVSGREFTEAAAFQSTVGFPELGGMENNAQVLYRMDNQGTASLRLDYLRPETAPTHGDDRLRIAGTKGVVEYQAGALTLMTGSRPPAEVTDLPAERSLFIDFLESLHGGAPHRLPVEDVFRVTEIVLKAREAAEEHRIVRM